MSRKKRQIDKIFKVFCEGDTEHSYFEYIGALFTGIFVALDSVGCLLGCVLIGLLASRNKTKSTDK